MEEKKYLVSRLVVRASMSEEIDAWACLRNDADLRRIDEGCTSFSDAIEEPPEPPLECAAEVAGRSGGLRVLSLLELVLEGARPGIKRLFLRKMEEPFEGGACGFMGFCAGRPLCIRA